MTTQREIKFVAGNATRKIMTELLGHSTTGTNSWKYKLNSKETCWTCGKTIRTGGYAVATNHYDANGNIDGMHIMHDKEYRCDKWKWIEGRNNKSPWEKSKYIDKAERALGEARVAMIQLERILENPYIKHLDMEMDRYRADTKECRELIAKFFNVYNSNGEPNMLQGDSQ